jgi:hypothetical protein
MATFSFPGVRIDREKLDIEFEISHTHGRKVMKATSELRQ